MLFQKDGVSPEIRVFVTVDALGDQCFENTGAADEQHEGRQYGHGFRTEQTGFSAGQEQQRQEQQDHHFRFDPAAHIAGITGQPGHLLLGEAEHVEDQHGKSVAGAAAGQDHGQQQGLLPAEQALIAVPEDPYEQEDQDDKAGVGDLDEAVIEGLFDQRLDIIFHGRAPGTPVGAGQDVHKARHAQLVQIELA